MQETMRKVLVTIEGKNMEINAIRIFCGINPRTNRCSVNFTDADNGKGIRLFWFERDQAEMLVQKIREGKITDLTEYQAKWNL